MGLGGRTYDAMAIAGGCRVLGVWSRDVFQRGRDEVIEVGEATELSVALTAVRSGAMGQ